MKKICLYFEEELLEALKNISIETGAPVSELIRRAIKKDLCEKGIPLDQRRIQPV